MPPRGAIFGIVVFWTFMTGWLFFREIWPRLQTGQPPPFRIELADEAQNNIPIRWSIFKNEEERGYARTAINYRDHDLDQKRRVRTPDDWEFELWGEFKLWNKGMEGQAPFVVRNHYRVTHEGELREFQSTVSINIETKSIDQATSISTLFRLLSKEKNNQDNEPSQEIEMVKLSGVIRDRFCFPRITVSDQLKEWIPLAALFERQMDPVPMPNQATLLNPLEPIHKLAKVRMGQRWRIPMVDPLAVFLKQSPRMQYLDAVVLDKTVWLKWGSKKDLVPCLVIEYQGDDISGHTWIQEEDGLVVRQEITQHGEKLELRRD
jgi:hypothetical protein